MQAAPIASPRSLNCKADRLAYKIDDDIPVMLVDEARKLSAEEAEKIQ